MSQTKPGKVCFYCGRPLPKVSALLNGESCCVKCWNEDDAICASCGAELTQSEAWIGDVCKVCHPFTEVEIALLREAGGEPA